MLELTKGKRCTPSGETVALSCIPGQMPSATEQMTAVSLSQSVVEHADTPTNTRGDEWATPKLKPTTVSTEPPEVGEFDGARSVMTGVS